MDKNPISIEDIHKDLINCFSETLEVTDSDHFNDNDDYNREISSLYDEFNSQIEEFNVHIYIFFLNK